MKTSKHVLDASRAKVAMVLNCGSSSVKYQLFQSEQSMIRGSIENIGLDTCLHKTTSNESIKMSSATYSDAISAAIKAATDLSFNIDCVGHRVVHGGSTLTKPTLIHDEVLNEIRDCCKLAPLHNPSNIKGIELAQDMLKSVPQIACFDTAFHASMPPKAYRYAIPREFADKHKIRRYGFHGLSYRYIASIVNEKRIIVAHLGSGCSAAAIVNGISLDTTMGFTPMEGLVMSTRSGTIDPGAVLYIANDFMGDISKVSNFLNKKSGLLGLSGFSQDMKELLAVQHSSDQRSFAATEAVEVFVYSTQKMIGQLMAALHYDVEAIVFTGGIGENSGQTRQMITEGFRGLEIALDPCMNMKPPNSGLISSSSSKIKIYAIKTNEELQIARDSLALIE